METPTISSPETAGPLSLHDSDTGHIAQDNVKGAYVWTISNGAIFLANHKLFTG